MLILFFSFLTTQVFPILLCFITFLVIASAAPPGFRFGGWNTLGVRPRIGSGGLPPTDAGEFSKIFKKLLKKIAKMHYFSIFFKKLNKPCASFARVWTQNRNCWEISEIFQKIS